MLTSITDVIFFDLPGVYCRSLISSWQNKRKKLPLDERKEKERPEIQICQENIEQDTEELAASEPILFESTAL